MSPRRRGPLPLVLALVLALPLVLDVQGVGAFRGWCRADPQFLIDGQLALVVVEARAGNMPNARSLSTGPIELVLTVPPGIQARHLASGNGFGHGYSVSIERSPDLHVTDRHIAVQVAVFVPMTDSTVPVRTSFMPAGDTESDTVTAAGRTRERGRLRSGAASGTVNVWIAIAA